MMAEIVYNPCGERDARVLFRIDSAGFLQCRQCCLEWVHLLLDVEGVRAL
jgi:hypothetical protein